MEGGKGGRASLVVAGVARLKAEAGLGGLATLPPSAQPGTLLQVLVLVLVLVQVQKPDATSKQG